MKRILHLPFGVGVADCSWRRSSTLTHTLLDVTHTTAPDTDAARVSSLGFGARCLRAGSNSHRARVALRVPRQYKSAAYSEGLQRSDSNCIRLDGAYIHGYRTIYFFLESGPIHTTGRHFHSGCGSRCSYVRRDRNDSYIVAWLYAIASPPINL